MAFTDQLEDWKEFETQKKLLILLVVVVGIGAYYYFEERAPLVAEVESLGAQQVQIRTDIAELRKISLLIPQIEADIDMQQRRLKLIQNSLPTTIGMNRLLSTLHNASKEVGLVVQSFKPGSLNGSESKFYAVFPIELTIEGAFSTILMFFDKITRLDRIIKVQKVKFSSPKKVFSKYHVKAKVNLKSYVNQQVASAGQGLKTGRRRRR